MKLFILLLSVLLVVPVVSSLSTTSLNEPPIVDVILSGNVVEIYANYYKYTFRITTFINDPENQLLQIKFYYRLDTGHRWTYLISYIGFDGVYKAQQSFIEQGLHDKTIYWMLEIIDGLNGFYYYYDYTIEV